MKPVGVKPNTYMDSSKEINDNDRKSTIFTLNCSEKVFVIKMSKVLCHGHMFLLILTEKELLEHSMKMNCKKQINQNLELQN